MSEFNELMRAITDRQLALMGLPALPSDPSNAAVQRGSPLWERLAKPTDGLCVECGHETDDWDADNEEWLCEECESFLVMQQQEDNRLDDPRHGQAREINAKFWDIP